MVERRARQLARTANCGVFGYKIVARTPAGAIYGPRGDEQKAYRANHWRQKAND